MRPPSPTPLTASSCGGPLHLLWHLVDADRAVGVVGGASSVTVAVPPEGPTRVSGVKVAHTPGGTNENARITVDFDTTKALEANLDTITIEFEDDVQVPDLLDERFISVVGTSGSVTLR